MKQKRLYVIILLLLGLTILLSACAGGTVGATNWPGVSANGDVIYLAYNTQVYAVNAAGGVEKWRYPAEKPDAKKTFYAAPVLTPDGLLAPSYNHNLYSLDQQTGAEKWVFDEAKDLYVASPLVTEKGIYAPNADGKLYALDFTLDIPASVTHQAIRVGSDMDVSVSVGGHSAALCKYNVDAVVKSIENDTQTRRSWAHPRGSRT